MTTKSEKQMKPTKIELEALPMFYDLLASKHFNELLDYQLEVGHLGKERVEQIRNDSMSKSIFKNAIQIGFSSGINYTIAKKGNLKRSKE